jgi:PAS domain S-box-containing protein
MPNGESNSEASELEAVLGSVQPGAVMEAIFGSTPSGALIARAPDGMILRVSDFALQLHGRPASDLVGHTLADDFGPTPVFDQNGRFLHAAERPLGRALRGETVTGVELLVETPSGERIAVISNAAPIRNLRGVLIGAISAITDTRPLKALEQSLRESEQQFRDLADSVAQFVWMADARGSIYWFNRRWYEYTGMSREEPMGWDWLKAVHPQHVDRVVARAHRTLEAGEPLEETFPLRSADGHYKWFLSRALPTKDGAGSVTRWFGTNTDVTDQLEAQELLRTLLKEVSHRVKNSLALVSSLLKLQARTLEGDARQSLEVAALRIHAVASVHDQLWRGAESREIDLKPFLSDLCASIATSAPRHKTVWRVERALVDSELAVPLGLLVNELLTNAYKHAYPQGEEGDVRVPGTCEPEGRYRIVVTDAGRGLPIDFDLAAVGTLGMRVITSLTAQLRGELTANSAEPGVRFSLEFPLPFKDMQASRTKP